MDNFTKEELLNNNSWAFQEAQKILERIEGKTPKKGYVLFETGYGPSGLPHIGTFAEVVRTTYVKWAFERLAPEIPTKLICVSDDLDGFRKVPTNVPNQEFLGQHLGKPLTAMPDPFGEYDSYGNYMNAKLRSFLDSFNLEYEFLSATEHYKTGKFNNLLLNVLDKYDELLDVLRPTLKNRADNYSPFLPIDPDTGKYIFTGVKGIDKEKATITYKDFSGNEKTISILDGNCKLQWKVDFGGRWADLDVDFEMYGKDHFENEEVYRAICKVLGNKPPVNFFYEMFLNEQGAKISKSKGNGVTVDTWLKYAPQESMSYYMYNKPRTAKRLTFDIIPKITDEYLTYIRKFPQHETNKEKLENPVFHIHNGNPPAPESDISFQLILNLVSVSNSESKEMLWKFINAYDSSLKAENCPMLDQLVGFAVQYYHDFIKPKKNYRLPTGKERDALMDLKSVLEKISKDTAAQDIQTEVYEIGKKHEFDKMKNWFKALYETLLGQSQGPRFGSFAALYGIDNTVKLIDEVLSKVEE